MKKKILIIVYLTLFFSASVVKAATCSHTERNELATLASNITVSYIDGSYTTRVNGDYVNTEEKFYLDIKIYGMDPKLRIVGKNLNNNNEYKLTMRNVNPADKSITIRQEAGFSINNYSFVVYGSLDTNCPLEVLRTFKITLPMYNTYSVMAMCDDIPDYYLCSRYVTIDTTRMDVAKAIKEYKSKLNKAKELTEKETATGTVSKVVNNLSKNKYWVAGGIIVIGIVLMVIIIIRRKRSDL